MKVAGSAEVAPLFGLADWIIERFRSRRRRLFELRWEATRLRERPVIWSLLIVLAANAAVFWSLGSDAASGVLTLSKVVTFASAAVSTKGLKALPAWRCPCVARLNWSVPFPGL